jgi:hypothetical protein
VSWLSTLPHCALYGKPILAGLIVIGNLGIWLAYMAIPIAIEIVRKRRGLPYNGLAVLLIRLKIYEDRTKAAVGAMI